MASRVTLTLTHIFHPRLQLQPRETRTPGTTPKYRTEDVVTRTGAGDDTDVRVLVGRDFYRRVILDARRDALVYFSFPTTSPRFHAAYAVTHAAAALLLANAREEEALEAADAAAAAATTIETHPRKKMKLKKTNSGGEADASSFDDDAVLIATIDAERNEVPHPYGSHIEGPTLLLYPAVRVASPTQPRVCAFIVIVSVVFHTQMRARLCRNDVRSCKNNDNVRCHCGRITNTSRGCCRIAFRVEAQMRRPRWRMCFRCCIVEAGR